ncbi:MAG: sigma-70 family RNA polymerase sigma factor [Sphingobium sp.]|nr:sigma-70 family RNA polymerase sigma factor [Sphingobium sp.]
MNAVTANRNIELLYESHAHWLNDWLRRHTKCPQRAADLTHDTFCRLLARPQAVAPDSPRSYLATIARRLLIDDIRSREVKRALNAAWAVAQSDTETITPERITEASQLLNAILQILDALPAQARKTFLLRRIEGLEHKQIAQQLDISLATVKRHIALAYARCYAAAYAD